MTTPTEARELSSALADYTGCTLAQMDKAAAMLTEYAALLEQAQPVAEPRVEFFDEWNCAHSLTIAQAAEELRQWTNAWPGGPEEVESSISQLKHRAAPAPAVPPLPDAEIIGIAQTMGKKVPGVSDYDSWPGMGYDRDANGEYTVPVVPKIAVRFARAIERKVRGE